jgi:hypothetical protein
VRNEIAKSAPMKPWPYGMPTVVNPFVVLLGPSPGNSPQLGDAAYAARPPYEKPTVGDVHPDFLYHDTKDYWPKVRELVVGIIRGFEPDLTAEDCYALSGQMNLGVGAFGNATALAVEQDYAHWVPRILIEKLRPRIIILMGLLSLLKDQAPIRQAFASSGTIEVNWNKPDRKFPFQHYRRKQMLFRAWDVCRPDGHTTTLISWPNHPSRSPMTNIDTWRASISEAVDYFTP